MPRSGPVQLVGTRPNGSTLKHPATDEAAAVAARERLAPICPDDLVWTIDTPERHKGDWGKVAAPTQEDTDGHSGQRPVRPRPPDGRH